LPSRSNSRPAGKRPAPPASGCSFILLHTRTSGRGLSRFREGSSLSSTIRKERRHENVTSNRPCSSSADDRHGNRGPDLEHRRRGRRRTRQVVRGGRVPTESLRSASWAVSRNRHASRPLDRRGRLAVLRLWRSAMPRRMTNWVNDDPWVSGVLEPILLLLCIALIGAVLGLI
jgi:hypothetical protein